MAMRLVLSCESREEETGEVVNAAGEMTMRRQSVVCFGLCNQKVVLVSDCIQIQYS